MRTVTSLTFLSLAVLLAVVAPLACNAARGEEEVIKVGAIFDLTGATSEVGIDYAAGVQDCFRYINEQGGINGRQIRLIAVDYQYDAAQAFAAYKKFVEQDKVIAIMGWGTKDTEALSAKAARDKIPYMSGSYSENVADPRESPYNFIVGTSYSDQFRIGLKWIKETWEDPSRPPRVAFIYNDTSYGRSPLEDGRAYAKKVGVEVVDEQIVNLRDLDATPQLLNMAKKDPDFAILQETANPTAVVLKCAKKLGLRTKFIAHNWGLDENLLKLAGDAADGHYGLVPFAFWADDDLPGIREMKAYYEKIHPGDPPRILRYCQGWATALVMAEGLRRMGDDLTGEALKEALESIRDFSTGGITSPISFLPTSHKGSVALRIYQVVDAKQGIVERVTGFVEMPREEF